VVWSITITSIVYENIVLFGVTTSTSIGICAQLTSSTAGFAGFSIQISTVVTLAFTLNQFKLRFALVALISIYT
jgi:hypothetical protein